MVITALTATSLNGRSADFFNTARLHNVVLSGGSELAALSGHDDTAPVPEAPTWALPAAGMCVARLRRLRHPARR